MAAIKGKDTKPEMIVRKYLFSRGAAVPGSGPKIAGHTGYCIAKVQDGNFCEWLFLARA